MRPSPIQSTLSLDLLPPRRSRDHRFVRGIVVVLALLVPVMLLLLMLMLMLMLMEA
ncbi:hypothetical protein OHB25_57420 [Streptomyces mirabilis]|uniref:hypothetical protein n=1 Tax=Streptomyces mirabilis TaxID=68239 RepID=UPI00224DBDEB|nr:hypothetical protein [Streptomyces mirabilis]MCX4617550.1 hypothetical protein [Streptomyces mirabilis]